MQNTLKQTVRDDATKAKDQAYTKKGGKLTVIRNVKWFPTAVCLRANCVEVGCPLVDQ